MAEELTSQHPSHFDVDHDFIAHLNGECHSWTGMDRSALLEAMQAQGEAWYRLVEERCPHLFAIVPVFVSELQLGRMHEVVAAIERIVRLTGWMQESPYERTPGVCYGYDFHLDEQGVNLIEINTNAGGAFLNALLLKSQREAGLYGTEIGDAEPEKSLLGMFVKEWQLARGDAPLQTIAIVDEQPESQYLYPEFLLAQRLFQRAGIAVHIADPSSLRYENGALLLDESRIDLVYNRLTDFTLRQCPALELAWREGGTVVTPNPMHHARYADKRNLARLSDVQELRALGATEADIATLAAGIPETLVVRPQDEERLWAERRQWFFKPNAGYGSKGAYRGEKLTKRVFGEIMQSDYVAQRLAPPAERVVCPQGGEPQALKYDVRCYVYEGHIQLVAARLYQGQTTNFRTPGGGFAPVRVVE